MSSHKDPRTGLYFFRKWAKLPSGKRKRLYGAVDEVGQPFKKKSEAAAAEQRAIEKLRNPDRGPVPLFGEWFNGRFWNEWVLGGPKGANSPSEQEAKRSIFRVHLADFFGELPLDRIDEALINTFRARLRALTKPDGSRQVGEKRINNILGVLSTPLQYAERVRVIVRAPAVGVAKVERPEIEFLEFEEVGALFAAARADREPEYELAVLLAFEAGLRIGEIKALAWPFVDMRARTITVAWQVRPAKQADDTIVETFGPPKGRRRRVVPMSPALAAALRDRIRTGFVVPGPAAAPAELLAALRDRPGSHFKWEAPPAHKRTSETRSAMERIAKRAGLDEKIGGEWHIGRHTFGTHAAMLGMNPWFLREWMGHQRLEETQLYADVARAHGRKIPPAVLAAGAELADANLRVLAQLSARGELELAHAEHKKERK
jgi:integrase